MKKIIFSLAVVLCAAVAKAQVAQGNFFIGGGLGFGSESTEATTGATTSNGNKTNTIFFKPQLGYFVTDNIAVGLQLNYAKSTTDNRVTPTPTEFQTRHFDFGLFARYHIAINEQFYFWPQADFNITSAKHSSKTASSETEGNTDHGFDIGITPGFSFFPSTRYGFNFSVGRLGYGSATTETPPTPTNPLTTESRDSGFNLKWDMSTINAGMTIFFGGE